MEKNSDAEEALTEIAAARQHLSAQIYTPWWYHPLLGLFLGLLMIQLGGVFGGLGTVLIPVPLLGTFALGRIYRRLSGVDLYGESSPDGGQRGRSLLAIYIYVLILCFVGVFIGSNQLGFEWVSWVLALLAVVGTIIVGRLYDGLLRTQVRGTP